MNEDKCVSKIEGKAAKDTEAREQLSLLRNRLDDARELIEPNVSVKEGESNE